MKNCDMCNKYHTNTFSTQILDYLNTIHLNYVHINGIIIIYYYHGVQKYICPIELETMYLSFLHTKYKMQFNNIIQ